jgi:Arm DNA-binding domain
LPRGGATRKVKIGAWPAVSLDDARKAARLIAGQVALQKDPAAERRIEKDRARNILSRALEDYDAALKRRHIVNRATLVSTLRRGLAPLLTREVAELTRAHFVDLIEAIANSGRLGAAGDLRKQSRAFLEFCVAKGAVQFNVLAGMRMPRSSRVERLVGGR